MRATKALANAARSTIEERSWQEFRDSGLAWWINRILHTFGWSLVFDIDDANCIVRVYPARTSWLGFSEADDQEQLGKFEEHLGLSLLAKRLEADNQVEEDTDHG